MFRIKRATEMSQTTEQAIRFLQKECLPLDTVLSPKVGWWWIGEIFDEWCYTMRSEDGEFFNYLQSDYVRYEEEIYYQDT